MGGSSGSHKTLRKAVLKTPLESVPEEDVLQHWEFQQKCLWEPMRHASVFEGCRSETPSKQQKWHVDSSQSRASGSRASESSRFCIVDFFKGMTGSRPCKTTLEVRNLPKSYTRKDFLELLGSLGFKGLFDFVYVPMGMRDCYNLGYAVVNMTTPESAKEIMGSLQGFTNWNEDSQQACKVNWGGSLQGITELIARYRNSPVMHQDVPEEYKPAVFHQGMIAPFPAPTRPISAPRLRGSF